MYFPQIGVLLNEILRRVGRMLPHNLSYTWKPQTQCLQWGTPIFVFLLYSSGISVFRKKCIFPKSQYMLMQYCAGLDHCYPIMSYTHGNLWTQRLRWCTPIFVFLIILSHCSVFCKHCISPWHYQLALSLYLHQLESHQLS